MFLREEKNNQYIGGHKMKLDLKTKVLTPVKAVRKYCSWCSSDSRDEIKNCSVSKCPIRPYRFGKRKVDPKPSLTPVKSIRARCIDCRGHEKKAVGTCQFSDCPLYPYRMGHRLTSGG